jgi:hypothetical protein
MLRVSFLFFGAALLVACDDADDAPAEYAAGTAAYHLVDSARAEPETPDAADHRELPARGHRAPRLRGPRHLAPVQGRRGDLPRPRRDAHRARGRGRDLAAAQSCLDDVRIRACSDLDGSVGSAVRPAAITRPFLLIGGRPSDLLAGQSPAFPEVVLDVRNARVP